MPAVAIRVGSELAAQRRVLRELLIGPGGDIHVSFAVGEPVLRDEGDAADLGDGAGGADHVQRRGGQGPTGDQHQERDEEEELFHVWFSCTPHKWVVRGNHVRRATTGPLEKRESSGTGTRATSCTCPR